jgi:hypothetical protein
MVRTPTNDELIDHWLGGRSGWSRRAYRADLEAFARSAGKPLYQVGSDDVAAYAEQMARESVPEAQRQHRLKRILGLVASARKQAASMASSQQCPSCGLYGLLGEYRTPQGARLLSCDECDLTFVDRNPERVEEGDRSLGDTLERLGVDYFDLVVVVGDAGDAPQLATGG